MSQTHFCVSKKRQNLQFDDISPEWAHRLGQPLPTIFSLTWFRWYLEIRNASKCVVGEAHGYSSAYQNICSTCNNYCINFMYSFLMHSSSRLAKNIMVFVRHWNENHNKGLVRSSK
jgi:hypothetical protein